MSPKTLRCSARLRWVTTIISAVILVSAAALLYTKSPSEQVESNSGVIDSFPDGSSEFKSIQFVGSQACAECHAGEWSKWQSHPMFLSMTEISSRATDEDFSAAEFSPLPKHII